MWGALRVHARRAFGTVSAPAWREGVALAAALWPFLVLAGAVATGLLQGAESARNAGFAAVEQPVWILELDALPFPNHGPVLPAQLATVAIAFVPAAYRAIAVVRRRAFLLWGPVAVAGLTASKAIVRWVDVIDHQDIVTWKPVPWLVVVGLAAGYACRSAVRRRAAALGDLGDLPSVFTSTALAQLGRAALAFTAAAALTRTRSEGGQRAVNR